VHRGHIIADVEDPDTRGLASPEKMKVGYGVTDTEAPTNQPAKSTQLILCVPKHFVIGERGEAGDQDWQDPERQPGGHGDIPESLLRGKGK